MIRTVDVLTLDLCLQSRQLEDENGLLTERNAQSAADLESLRLQLEERREGLPAEGNARVSGGRGVLVSSRCGVSLTEPALCQVAACVSALEAELTKALEDSAQLEDRNLQLSQTLREKVSLVSVRQILPPPS